MTEDAAALDPRMTTLIDEVTKKSGLVWVQVPGRRPQPVWHLWHDGSAYVVSGGSEQPDPGLADTPLARVSVRSKDNGSRVVVWEAHVEPVQPDSERWTTVGPLLLAKRLNAPDGAAAPARWAAECRVYRLTPTGRLLETPDDPYPGSGAASPPPTPAATRVRRPFTIGRRRR